MITTPFRTLPNKMACLILSTATALPGSFLSSVLKAIDVSIVDTYTVTAFSSSTPALEQSEHVVLLANGASELSTDDIRMAIKNIGSGGRLTCLEALSEVCDVNVGKQSEPAAV